MRNSNMPLIVKTGCAQSLKKNINPFTIRKNDHYPYPPDNAARSLTELAGLLPTTSPLFPGMRQLRSIIHAAQQSLARQQQPQDLEKGLDLITTIEECLTSKPK